MFFSSDPASPGGVQEHVYYLAVNLKKLGHQLTVFTPHRSSLLPYPGIRSIGEFSEVSLPIGYDVSFVSKKKNEDYMNIINGKDYDLLHIHDPFMPFLSWELVNKLDLPLITTYHATWDSDSITNVFNGFIPYLKDSMSSRVKGSIFVSRRTRKCWEEILHSRTKKTIIDNGIDRKMFFYKKKRETDKINILFLARIVPKKGLHILLAALKKLTHRHKNILLTVAGVGPDRERLMKYVKTHKLNPFVKFLGYVDFKDKPVLYQRADIFAAPYSNEGFGITILEAMATGTPVVGFRNNAFEEILAKYPNPELILEKKNATALAAALEKLINSHKIREKIIKWELQEIKKYDWEKIASQTESFYYKVLKNI